MDWHNVPRGALGALGIPSKREKSAHLHAANFSAGAGDPPEALERAAQRLAGGVLAAQALGLGLYLCRTHRRP